MVREERAIKEQSLHDTTTSYYRFKTEEQGGSMWMHQISNKRTSQGGPKLLLDLTQGGPKLLLEPEESCYRFPDVTVYGQ